MSILEELNSILSLPDGDADGKVSAASEWTADMKVFTVGIFVEMFGEESTSRFFTGSGDHVDSNDLSEMVESVPVFRTPDIVSKASGYFPESSGMWAESFAESLLSGVMGECWADESGVAPIYESAFIGWIEKLKSTYGFCPSEGSLHSVPSNIQEICYDLMVSVNEMRRETVVDRGAVASAVRILS